MPLPDKQIDEIRASIKLARKRALNFGLCLGGKPEETVFLDDKIKPPAALGRNAKKAGTTPKMCAGTFVVDGRIIALTCEENPPTGIAKGLKKFLNLAKQRLKVQVLDAQGNILEEEDDEEQVTAPASSPPPRPPEAPPEPDVSLDQRKYEALVQKLTPMVQKATQTKVPNSDKIIAIWALAKKRAGGKDFATAVKALMSLAPLLSVKPAAAPETDGKPPGWEKWVAASGRVAPRIAPLEGRTDPAAQKVLSAWSRIIALAEAGQIDKALAALPQVIKALLLVPPVAAKAAEVAEAPTGDVIELGSIVRDIWDDATSVTDRQLDALFAKIRSASDPAAAKIADLGLNAWSKGARTDVTKALLKLSGKTSQTADPATRKQAAAAFRAYRQFLGMHPAVRLLEKNAYNLPVDLTGTLGGALTEMENTVLTG